MFSDRRNDGPNTSEDLRTLECAEGSRDLHAQLHHAQVPFCLIVGEGNCEVRKEQARSSFNMDHSIGALQGCLRVTNLFALLKLKVNLAYK